MEHPSGFVDAEHLDQSLTVGLRGDGGQRAGEQVPTRPGVRSSGGLRPEPDRVEILTANISKRPSALRANAIDVIRAPTDAATARSTGELTGSTVPAGAFCARTVLGGAELPTLVTVPTLRCAAVRALCSAA